MTSSAWNTISQNRRINPRYKLRIPASVSVVETETNESHWPSVLAHTRDISREGMALVMPSAMMGCHNLEDGDFVLRIVLGISTPTSVTITARLVHCTLLSAKQMDQGYLVGVRFEQISQEDQALYEEFIASLTPKK